MDGIQKFLYSIGQIASQRKGIKRVLRGQRVITMSCARISDYEIGFNRIIKYQGREICLNNIPVKIGKERVRFIDLINMQIHNAPDVRPCEELPPSLYFEDVNAKLFSNFLKSGSFKHASFLQKVYLLNKQLTSI